MSLSGRIRQQPFQDKIALVCGGSQGIGRATAREIVQLGGSVCLVARHRDVLAEAAAEMRALQTTPAQFVETIACDTTDMERLQPLVEDFIARHRVPDYLLNLVGFAYPQYVQNLTLDDFRQAMEVNYYGQLVPILILLPYFMRARQGHIANVSSMMGYFGIIGYAGYAPTKFALVGLTEVLRNELRDYNIRFSILYPPDTDTPGFARENGSKPPETSMLSETTSLMTPEQVAQVFIEGILQGKVDIHPGESRWIWRLYRFFPGLVRLVMDRQLTSVRRKLGRSGSGLPDILNLPTDGGQT